MNEKTERNRLIAAAYKSGARVRDIARQWDMRASNIYHILKREGVATGKKGWHGNPEGHRVAGKIGGTVTGQNRDHMAEIGRRGGRKVSQDREHMAAIGRKGGQASQNYQREREKEDNEYTEAWVTA